MARAHTHSSTKSKYKVVLVDDHPILREGFAQIINQEPDLQVCGQQYLSRRMHERMLDTLYGRSAARIDPSLELPRLSDRQLEIFQLIGEGRGTRQIALQLHLSIKTVETHRAHIKEKLKLHSGLELIRHAVEMAGRFSHSAAEREDLRPAEPAVTL